MQIELKFQKPAKVTANIMFLNYDNIFRFIMYNKINSFKNLLCRASYLMQS